MGVKGEPGVSQDDGGVKAEATKHSITIKMGHSDEDIQLKAKGTTRFEKIYSLGFEEEEQIDFHMTQIGGSSSSRS
ncbi:hypothetical protein JCM11251_004008 [Rhodosporidiobolus azoricus]